MKAQIFSLDLIIAIGIFIIVLLSISWAWDYTNQKIFSDEKRVDLEIIARNAIASLVETQGNPTDWETLLEADFDENNIYSLGLVKNNFGNNVIDANKIQRLDTLDLAKYETYKKILGILGPNYEFQLKIAIWGGASYSDLYTVGLAPTATTKRVINIDRMAILDTSFAKINIKVWENE